MKIILKLFFVILITVQSGCKSDNEENKKAAVTAPAIIRNKPKQNFLQIFSLLPKETLPAGCLFQQALKILFM